MAKQAQQIGLINDEEFSTLEVIEHARDDIIQVDYFDPEVYRQLR